MLVTASGQINRYMEGLQTITAIVSLLLYLSTTLTECVVPVTRPMTDQFIAINSEDNVTYNCSVDSGNVVVWEVERSQIRSDAQFVQIANLGFIIDPSNTMSGFSTITISPPARANNAEILVQCLASQGINSIEGTIYLVVTFDRPEPPGDLILEPALTLEWNRPLNIPGSENVAVDYTVMINSTDNSGMNFQNVTSMTSISVRFLEEILITQGSQCVEFEFFVSATNDAGTGPSARILDTVPISPDVTNVNNALRVERVDLRTLSADISFPPVQPCSPNFPLTNYTLNINTAVSRVLLPGDVMPGEPVTLSGLPRDNSFSLTVTACNNVICRTSAPRTLNTTDVQSAEAVFFENRLFLRCSFADNSQAQGCIVRLTLSSTNETESFQISRGSGSMCTTANNQREAYSSVVVLDWEENGMEGNLILNITQSVVNVTSLERYIELTGCRDAQDNTSAIVGGVLGSIAFFLLISVVAVLLAIFFVDRQAKKRAYAQGGPPPPPIFPKLRLLRRPDDEKEALMLECDMEAEDECAEHIKRNLRDVQPDDSITSSKEGQSIVLQQMQSPPSLDPRDKEAWIEGHDEIDKPLTINVRLKPLVQSLIAFRSLQPSADNTPLLRDGKDLRKVKVQLHI